MLKYSVAYFVVVLFVASYVECGVYPRLSSYQQQPTGRLVYGQQYEHYPISNRRISPNNPIDQLQSGSAHKINPRTTGSGLSAWGLITIIMLIIVVGMGGYYGIICYPLICKEERNYDIMDAASTTASANTPTRSGDFEKPGNYSSRSTTPSVIINT
ncbi:uncharacterized protein LOC116343396 [Contarinia nasturtii]|uniref:uncharacterized protein LOC116343396 n=1 Tax=Contarinia nasturtii TaxID=265458 RepID=UPI0012D3E557|nr:uncharacterized protein LOC116343396 [Contarinia nasturtii]